jgi:hypothetical protein
VVTAAEVAPTAPQSPTEEAVDPVALAEDLEAALFAALDEETPEQELLSVRSLRLARAEALASGALVDDVPEAPSVMDSEYVSMIKSYGPFPVLLPADRDFRPALALSVFGGFLGLDRFYEGKPATGILKLATAGGAGIWWIADIVSILRGRTTDRDGHRFTGEKKHRAVAWALTGALFAGLTSIGVNAAAPGVTATVGAVHEVLFPTPVPVPTWATLADMTGTTDATVLQVTGERLRFTYDFPGPVYAYLQNEGDTAIPAESLLLTDGSAHGVKEVDATPGTYRLVVRANGTAWTVKAEELGLHG